MLWSTAPRPHVDRCATAWLIRRFIDPEARFVFGPAPAGATPFDMPGAAYGHHGDACTFETTLAKHGLDKDPALADLAALVHDLDFHRMRRAESAGLDAVLTGILLDEPDDQRALVRAFAVFDALHARAKAR